MDDLLYIPAIRQAVQNGDETVKAYIINNSGKVDIDLKLESLSQDDRDIILAGCLINYYAKYAGGGSGVASHLQPFGLTIKFFKLTVCNI